MLIMAYSHVTLENSHLISMGVGGRDKRLLAKQTFFQHSEKGNLKKKLCMICLKSVITKKHFYTKYQEQTFSASSSAPTPYISIAAPLRTQGNWHFQSYPPFTSKFPHSACVEGGKFPIYHGDLPNSWYM